MAEHKITIIMPAYNSERYIVEAIESVICQSYSNWELIVIDDGSTDNTGRIVDEYAMKNNKIKVIHGKNEGVSHARNIGLDNASGEWIVFLDSDDVLPKQAIEKMVLASEGQDLIIGSHCEFSNSCKKIILKDEKNVDKVQLVKSNEVIGVVWARLFNRRCLTERFDENINYSEDTLFFYGQLRKCKNVSTIKDVVYKYRREDTSSLSYQKQNIKVLFVIKLCSILKELLEGDIELYYACAAHYCIGYAIRIMKNKNIDKEKKYEMINEIVANQCFNEIPIVGLKIKSRERRLLLLLKAGDIALFEKELKVENKRD